MNKRCFLPFLIVVIACFLILSFRKFSGQEFFSFSDAAKYADVARNLVTGRGYGTTFSFFLEPNLVRTSSGLFSGDWILPGMPLSILAFFLLFGVSDTAVVAVSGLFYLLLVFSIFLLGRKIFGEFAGLLSALVVAANPNFLDYATSGASETLFALEIVLGAYLFVLRKKWADVAGLLMLTLMYFTRPQAFIYIAGFLLLWLLLRFKTQKAILYFIAVSILVLVFDYLILRPLTGKYFLYSIFARSEFVITQHLPGEAASLSLRGAIQSVGFIGIFKKVFYNLYNFYKLLPQIASPYMWALFVIGLFVWTKDRLQNSLKIATIFMVVITFLVTALTIPFFRYLHPVIPLVYLSAVATLVWIVESIFNFQFSIFNYFKRKLPRLKRQLLIAGVSSLLILFFAIGQTLGVIFLDSRFKAKLVNRGKPPVYVQLSWKLKEVTNPNDIIITNLDTWGSWYGERKTVWFPLKPAQLIPPEGKENPFDAIYLTSYLMDDENYYMGEEWRQIFENPEKPENEFIKANYTLKGIYEIPAETTYEKQPARAILLVKK